MEFSISVLLYLLVTVVSIQALKLIYTASKDNSGKLPPGPARKPIIGNLLDLGDKPHKTLTKLAKVYGPIMSLKLGQVTTIVISSAALAKEVLQKQDLIFSNRNIPVAAHSHQHDQFSIGWLPVAGPWRNLRKVCNSYIFTTQKLDANQDLRRLKVQELLAYVQQSCDAGKPVDIRKAAFIATLNALSNTILSFDLTDSSLVTIQEFRDLVRCLAVELGKPNMADYFPILSAFDVQGIQRRTGICTGKLLSLFDKLIHERLELRKEQGYVQSNDMLDTLLNICEDKSEEMDVNKIKHLFMDLFAAAADTTANTLEWGMTELLCNSKTLSKAKAELEQTIGKGNMLKESDIARLPYLQAIVKENLRLHPAAPFLVPRKAGADLEMCGYTIPKDAQVLVNALAIGTDPSVWEDPNTFVPERFMGSDLDVGGRDFEFIPFGGGRRICPGLPLAMRMVPLMLGSLIHSFDWKLEDGVTPENMDMEDKFGITLQKAQPLRAIPVRV